VEDEQRVIERSARERAFREEVAELERKWRRGAPECTFSSDSSSGEEEDDEADDRTVISADR
jgi:hypothetical protein